MADLNEEVRAKLDRDLYQATCKGVQRLTDDTVEVVFEKDGETLVFQVFSDERGIVPVVVRRTL